MKILRILQKVARAAMLLVLTYVLFVVYTLWGVWTGNRNPSVSAATQEANQLIIRAEGMEPLKTEAIEFFKRRKNNESGFLAGADTKDFPHIKALGNIRSIEHFANNYPCISIAVRTRLDGFWLYVFQPDAGQRIRLGSDFHKVSDFVYVALPNKDVD